MNIQNIPTTYQPFSTLVFGENRFAKVEAIVTIGGVAPLLIGNGSSPRVWLSVPGEMLGSPWRQVIADNLSSLPGLSVQSHPRVVSIKLDQATVLTAVLDDGGKLTIMKLDLRPVGLDIFFENSQDGLHVFGSTMVKNTFVGVPAAMVFGSIP